MRAFSRSKQILWFFCMPYPGDWQLCRLWNCPERVLLPAMTDRTSARQWFQRFQSDSSKMRAMRAFLATALGSTDISNISDPQVVTRIADLVVSGIAHLHAAGYQAAAAPQGGSAIQPIKAVTAQPAAFPLQNRNLQMPAAASTGILAILEEFLPDVDLVAQAADLTAAAATGKPFCVE